MNEMHVSAGARRRIWLAAIGACALWLVIQNTMLLIGYFWARPSDAAVVASALFKTAVMLMDGFWLYPVVGCALAGALGLAAGAALPGAKPVRP